MDEIERERESHMLQKKVIFLSLIHHEITAQKCWEIRMFDWHDNDPEIKRTFLTKALQLSDTTRLIDFHSLKFKMSLPRPIPVESLFHVRFDF